MSVSCRQAAILLVAIMLTGRALLPGAALCGSVADAVRKCKEAREAYERGQVDLAIKLYTEAIEINPDYAEAYYQRGELYRGRKQWDKAVADVESTLARDPKHLGALRRRGSDFFHNGKYAEAAADYTLAVKMKDHTWYDYYMRGRALAAMEECESSLKDFNRAIDEWPKASHVYYERGKLYVHLGKLKRAEQDFTSTVTYDPKHAGAHFELGKLRFGEGKYDEALKFFTQAHRYTEGGDGASLYWRGRTSAALKDYESAIKDYTAAIGRAYDTPELRYYRAAAYFALGKLEEARGDLKRAIEGDQENERYRWALQRVEQLLEKQKSGNEGDGGAKDETGRGSTRGGG